MAALIVLDVSRLVFSGWRRTPTGIPRVELAYAEHFIASAPERLRFAVLDGFGRLSIIENGIAIPFVSAIARFWRTDVGSTRAFLTIALRALLLHAALLFRRRDSLRRLAAKHRNPTIYVIPSHLHMDRRRLMERLKAIPNLKLVYFVHDIIPYLFPEYCPPAELLRDQQRMEAAVRFADALIVNSQHTATTFSRVYADGTAQVPIIVAPLGVTTQAARINSGLRPKMPAYFVTVGTIEPRKNHLLLLNVWRGLSVQFANSAPRLVIIGARGWENENVVDMLDRSPGLHGLVEERPRVSDDEMAQLLVGSCAVLMPSFAEGYGLPLAEALSLGVPAICSDIPAHREVGGDVPEFLDPLDGPGWRNAILNYSVPDSSRRLAQLDRLASWQRPTWQEHFDRVERLLEGLDSTFTTSVEQSRT